MLYGKEKKQERREVLGDERAEYLTLFEPIIKHILVIRDKQGTPTEYGNKDETES